MGLLNSSSLAIVNCAAVNIGVHLCFWISSLVLIYPRVGLLDYMLVLYLIFWGTAVLFSIVAVPIYAPTNSRRGFPFLHTISVIHYLYIVNIGHSDQCEMVPHCRFYFISLIIGDIGLIFMCLLDIHIASLEKCLFRSSAHFSIAWVCCLLVYENFV